MQSQIQEKANEFLRIISPELDASKLEYLSWRVCGFSKSEAMAFAYITVEMEREWAEDEVFTTLEQKALSELQGTFAEDIMSLLQKKNSRVVSGLDTKIIQKAFLLGLDSLSKQEFSYLTQIRNQYNPDVRRILGDEDSQIHIPASFDEAVVLLRKRNSNEHDTSQGPAISENIIEAEYTESPKLPEGNEAGTTEEDAT